jgi:hypothetical protein
VAIDDAADFCRNGDRRSCRNGDRRECCGCKRAEEMECGVLWHARIMRAASFLYYPAARVWRERVHVDEQVVQPRFQEVDEELQEFVVAEPGLRLGAIYEALSGALDAVRSLFQQVV